MKPIISLYVNIIVKSEWASYCCLSQLSNVSAISRWEQVNYQLNDDEVCFVLDQHA
jgi:hypothetical protein